jgi:hypothetical protein
MTTKASKRMPAEVLYLDIYNERVVVSFTSTSGTHQVTRVIEDFDQWQEFYLSKKVEASRAGVIQLGLRASTRFVESLRSPNTQLRGLAWKVMNSTR